MNVFEMRPSDPDVGLIARLDGQPGFAVSDVSLFDNRFALWFYQPQPGGQWADWFPVPKPDPFIHFPYGWNVEPD